MRRFLASALSATALALTPIAAHAAPQDSATVFLSKLKGLLMYGGLDQQYEMVEEYPEAAIEVGMGYCKAKAKGMSEDEITKIIAEKIVENASNETSEFFYAYFASINVMADRHLCSGT